MASAVLDRWLDAVVATRGLTSLSDLAEARRVLLDDALRATDLARSLPGNLVDVGSGGGTPGLPLAVALPDREVTLIESQERKAEFLRRWAAEIPNVTVICERAEEQPLEQYGVALAKALAAPPVAAELCLPLVRPGGAAVLWVGPSADRGHVSRVAEALAGELVASAEGLLVIRKQGPTPPGFPRKPGIAAKRPLG